MAKLSKFLTPAPAGPPKPPQTLWDKVLNYTPVVMTVIATLLAGMSNSELSAAQYDRAAAAQYQSKAADQWNFFQVKKIRGSSLDNTLDLVQNFTQAGAFDPASLQFGASQWPHRLAAAVEDARKACEGLAAEQRPPIDAALRALATRSEEAAKAGADLSTILAGAKDLSSIGATPSFTPKPIASREIKAAVDAIEANKPDEQIAPLLKQIDKPAWDQALSTSESNSAALDAATGPQGKILDSLRPALMRLAGSANACARATRELADLAGPAGDPNAKAALADALSRLTLLSSDIQAANADFTSTRLRFGARRYALESPLNQELAELTEIQVRQSNIQAEEHRTRSRLFFYGVLVAQAAVIGATLALAMQQKSLLWSLAAAAGIAAISFGVYVRVFV